jgi:formylglycine-generating enzyme required for sulfatase activity
MLYLKKHRNFIPLLRSLKFVRRAFLLLIVVVGCNNELPIEPIQEDVGDALVVLYQDSIGVLTDITYFDPTFIGDSNAVEVLIAYMDTFTLKLKVELSDSNIFSVTPRSFDFSKSSSQRQQTFTIYFKPVATDTLTTTYLHLKTFSDLLSPDSSMEMVAHDSLHLVGQGQSYYLDMEMIFVERGSFPMGSGTVEDTADAKFPNPDELYSHQVTVSDFFIGRYEVTNQQYYEFWLEQSDTTYRPDYSSVIGTWPEDVSKKPNHPVVGVNWEDAMAFCRWLSLRTSHSYTLPTEAQWEYAAAGGGDGREYPWSVADSSEDGMVSRANTEGNGDGYMYTAPVDQFQAGAGKFGNLNMSGNVWEWCLDWYDSDYYQYSIGVDDPQGPSDSPDLFYKVIRGGSWLEGLSEARCANRGALDPNNRENNVGFRVVRLP